MAAEVVEELERLRAELSAMRVQRAVERARDGWAEVERLRAEVESLRATAEREAASSPNGADRAEAAERALAYDAVLALFK